MLALTSPVVPMFNTPDMPAPPTTTRAPEVVFVLAVPLAATMLPALVRPVKVPTVVIFACDAEAAVRVPVKIAPTLPMSGDLTVVAMIPALNMLRPL